MLTDQDIKKLVEVFATRDEIEALLERKADKDDILMLTSSIDAVLKRLETLTTEFISITNKVNRLEEWIKILADKTGVKLPT